MHEAPALQSMMHIFIPLLHIEAVFKFKPMTPISHWNNLNLQKHKYDMLPCQKHKMLITNIEDSNNQPTVSDINLRIDCSCWGTNHNLHSAFKQYEDTVILGCMSDQSYTEKK